MEAIAVRITRRIFRACLLIVFILGIIVAALNLFSATIVSTLPANLAAFVNSINNLTTTYITYVFLGLIIIALYYFLRLIFKIYNREMLDIYDPKTRVPKQEHEQVEKVLYTKTEKAEFDLEPKSLVIDHDEKEIKDAPIQGAVIAAKQAEVPVVKEAKQAEVPVQMAAPIVAPPIVEEKVKPVAPVVEIKKALPKDLKGLHKFKTINFELYPGLVVKVGAGWKPVLEQEKDKPYYKELMNFIKSEYENKTVYPEKEDIFKCLELTDLSNVRAVIIGKIPYYRKDQADGLAFSTKLGSDINQTTEIIVQEAINDVGIPPVKHGSFVNWAQQGVLLINSVFTAPSDRPASHADWGWLEFSNALLEQVRRENNPVGVLLWGSHGAEYEEALTYENALVLKAPNPSPLSAANGFYDSKPFSKVNEFLIAKGYQAIDWKL